MKNPAEDPYNRAVREYFVNPVHAGPLQRSYSFEARAQVDDGGGTLLVLLAGVEGRNIAEIRFQAIACPHLLAAAEHFCRQYSGMPVGSLNEFQPEALIEELAVPTGKTGRILLLEDAVRSLWQEINGETGN